jgi:hypothetical protein
MIPQLAINQHAALLTAVLTLAGDVLGQLAASDAPEFDRAEFEAQLSNGRWLLDRLDQQLADVAALSRDERTALYEAFINDISFDCHIDASDFAFRFPGLPRHVRSVGRRLLVAFYEILRQGYPALDGAAPGFVLDRRSLERGFFDPNGTPRPCPACLELDMYAADDGSPSTTSCDHYLPKYLYPALSVHPANLVFVCMPCNDRRKGRRDPLTACRGSAAVDERTARGALLRTYLPFLRHAAPDLRFTFSPGAVALTAESEAARERVANLDRVYRLAETWTKVLPQIVDEFYVDVCVGQQREPSANAVREVLGKAVRIGERYTTERKGALLKGRYAEHLLDGQVDALSAEWMRRREEELSAGALRDEPDDAVLASET